MIRVIEILLFLAPFAVFAFWRVLMPGTAISTKHIAVLGAALALCFGLLVWLRQHDAEPANATYVPAELHGREIVPPRAEP
ncbi:MAG: DUF6111 family protein [Acetobacteraceae bacterium]